MKVLFIEFVLMELKQKMEVMVEDSVQNIILKKIQKLLLHVEAKNQEEKEEIVKDFGVKVLGIMEVDYVKQNLKMNFL